MPYVTIPPAPSHLQPRLMLEFGGYCGYSAVLIGSHLPPGARLISMEINPVFAAIATKIIEHAGLADRVQVWVGDIPALMPRVREECGGPGCVDAVFIDHWKELYLPHTRALEASGLLHVGSTLIADNIIYPGAPDYLAYVQSAPERYRTVVHEAHLEYSATARDAVAVSQVLALPPPA
jgi:catechol O-methyltransferase